MKLLPLLLCYTELFAQTLIPPLQIPTNDYKPWNLTVENLQSTSLTWGKINTFLDGGVGFTFQTPTSGHSDNYFWYQFPGKSTLDMTACPNFCTLVLTMKIAGDGFISTDPADLQPPSIHVIFGTPRWVDRWWAVSSDPTVVTSYTTAAGIYTFTIPIQPQYAGAHYGPSDWLTSFKNIQMIGVTFGGYYFYGHGNAGNGTFEILSGSIF